MRLYSTNAGRWAGNRNDAARLARALEHLDDRKRTDAANCDRQRNEPRIVVDRDTPRQPDQDFTCQFDIGRRDRPVPKERQMLRITYKSVNFCKG